MFQEVQSVFLAPLPLFSDIGPWKFGFSGEKIVKTNASNFSFIKPRAVWSLIFPLSPVQQVGSSHMVVMRGRLGKTRHRPGQDLVGEREQGEHHLDFFWRAVYHWG